MPGVWFLFYALSNLQRVPRKTTDLAIVKDITIVIFRGPRCIHVAMFIKPENCVYQVIRELQNYKDDFRVLALSATPGDNLNTVQSVLTNLLISHIEVPWWSYALRKRCRPGKENSLYVAHNLHYLYIIPTVTVMEITRNNRIKNITLWRCRLKYQITGNIKFWNSGCPVDSNRYYRLLPSVQCTALLIHSEMKLL